MGTAERKQREKERRRDEIIAAAEKVFFKNGIGAATVDQIAEIAEVSKGTIYLYFKNKEDLAFAVSLRGAAIITEKFEKAVATEKKGIDKISAIGRAYWDFYVEYPEYAKFMNQLAEEQDVAGRYVEQCAQESLKVYQIMVSAIEVGIADGTIRKELNPAMTAMLLSNFSTGLMNAVVNQGEALRGIMGLDVEQYIGYAFDFMKLGLRAE